MPLRAIQLEMPIEGVFLALAAIPPREVRRPKWKFGRDLTVVGRFSQDRNPPVRAGRRTLPIFAARAAYWPLTTGGVLD